MTLEREQAVGARLRAAREARQMTLVEAEAACGELSKSSISLIELTPNGAELLPCADAYARWLGFELVRRYGYELRRLPEREDSRARASEAADSSSSSKSGNRRRRGLEKTSSSSATASRASSTSRSGSRRTTPSKRRARRGGR